MTSPQIAVKAPVNNGTDSHGFAWKAVTVRMVNLRRRLALCEDEFGRHMEIRCDIMRSKGNLPETGEQWIIDRALGDWQFAAILNGTTRGVEVSNVTDLPENLQTINNTAAANKQQLQGNIDTVSAATAANAGVTSALTAATTGRITTKGDLLAGTGPGVLARQAVGADSSYLVADSTQTTGLAYREGLALSKGITGAVATGRLVGYTPSVAPTTGTFKVGDWIQTLTGDSWVCTVAGTPGTWISPTQQIRDELYGAGTRTQNPYCRVRFSGTYDHQVAVPGGTNDIFAAGGWTLVDQTETMRYTDGSGFVYIKVPVAGRYRLQFKFQGTAKSDTVSSVVALKITRNARSINSTVVAGTGWNPGYGNEVAITAVDDVYLAANDTLYWCSYVSGGTIMQGSNFGAAYTSMTVMYVRGA
jgi:hypothetical protein